MLKIAKADIVIGVYIVLMAMHYFQHPTGTSALSAVSQDSKPAEIVQLASPYLEIVENQPVVSYGQNQAKGSLTLLLNSNQAWELTGYLTKQIPGMSIDALEITPEFSCSSSITLPIQISEDASLLHSDKPTPDGGLKVKVFYTLNDIKDLLEFSFPLTFDLIEK